MNNPILIDHETPYELLCSAFERIMTEIVVRKGDGYLIALLFGTAVKFIIDKEKDEDGGQEN